MTKIALSSFTTFTLMQTRNLLILCLSLLYIGAPAQNLVLNPGFELTTSCPTNVSHFDGYATHWTTFAGTPDQFHACGFQGSSTTTNSTAPHSGDGFAGFYVYGSFGQTYNREYMHGKLSAPLNADEVYSVEFFVHPVNVDIVQISYGIDQFSVYFSPFPLDSVPPNQLLDFVTPQVNNTAGNVFVSPQWHRVQGCFVAEGGEQELAVGNFRTDAATTVQPLPGAAQPDLAYFLMDDISVISLGTFPELPADTTLCPEETLFVDLTVPGGTYLWHDNSTASTYTVTEAGWVWAEVTLGECSRRDSMYVDFHTLPTVELGPDTTLCPQDDLMLTVTTTGDSVLWSTGATTPSIVVEEAGTIWVEVAHACGAVSDTLTIEEIECPCEAFVPNVMTPNYDSFSDVFDIELTCETSAYHLRIYDRWGVLLYDVIDPEEKWTGRFKDKEVPAGVYYYVLELTWLYDGDTFEQAGSLTVLR